MIDHKIQLELLKLTERQPLLLQQQFEMGEEGETEVKQGFSFTIEIRHADMEQTMQVSL